MARDLIPLQHLGMTPMGQLLPVWPVAIDGSSPLSSGRNRPNWLLYPWQLP